MTRSFFIPFRLPGLNEILDAARVRVHGKRGRVTNKYSLAKRETCPVISALATRAGVMPVRGRVVVAFEWHEPNRRRDVDNVAAGAKFILDALVHAGILPDDSQKWVAGLTHSFLVDPQKPGVFVSLCPEKEV